ncbi:MAG: hypothetical protein QS98_C0010G0060 [archaeon GW2011_AR3]|nr:MAG: hypothetical protein QS98_C0010G0060 [archaeon GW2011_AR3]
MDSKTPKTEEKTKETNLLPTENKVVSWVQIPVVPSINSVDNY